MPSRTEAAKSSIRSEYDRLARQYDRRWEAYTDATIRETLVRFPVAAEERVLDVGCGTGVLLEALAATAPGATLTGIDVSREMLAVARRRGAGVLRWVTGEAAALPFADGRFDAVVSSNSFHFWIDPAAALREIRRVLKPAGRLVVSDWCHDYLACRVCDSVLRLFRRIPHRSYGSVECASHLRAAGFEIERLDTYKINWLWGMMTIAARVPSPP